MQVGRKVGEMAIMILNVDSDFKGISISLSARNVIEAKTIIL